MTVPKGHAGGSLSLTFEQFWQRCGHRVDAETGAVVTPTPHREQARFVQAVDANRYHELMLHWSKQTGKSSTAGAWLMHHLVADPYHRGERLSGIASNDEDQSAVIFHECEKIIDLDPWLSKNVRVLRSEIVYTERRRDPKTGGRFVLDHRILKLPRDLAGTHGKQFSRIVRDELWSEPDHAFSESLIISPACPSGAILYCSYFPPNVLMKAGAPFFDLLKRVEAKDPTLFYSYIGGRGADAATAVVPWVTQAWVERQEKILQASPSRFKRIILNVPAGPDAGGLITAAELRDAQALLVEPATGAEGVTYFAAVDLGVKIDWSTLLVGHVDADGRLVIDVVRTWKPAPDRAVSLMDVSQELRTLHARFPWRRLCLDQSQSRLIAEQLARDGIPAEVLEVGAGDVNRLVTGLKGAFARRLVRIPSSAVDLVEQLESVQAVETRRGLLRLQEGTTSADARGHDDLAFALALLVDMTGAELGRAGLPESFNVCNRVLSGIESKNGVCYLFHGGWRPPEDACCSACIGHVAVKNAYETHINGGGEPMPLRVYRERFIGDNGYTERAAWARLARDLGERLGV